MPGGSPSAASALPAAPSPSRFVPFIAPAAVTADDLVVDLRSLDEAPQSPFAGARRLDVDACRGAAREQPCHLSRRIVLCCRSGQRALAAADRLRERRSRQSGFGGIGLVVRRRVVMTLHTTDKTVLESHRGTRDRGEEALRPGRDVGRRARAPGQDQRRARPLLGPAAPAPWRCASTAAIPTRPRCARRRSSRTTRVKTSSERGRPARS